MKTHNGQTRLQFVAFLRHTLIPDLVAADMNATAEDFETALQFLCDDVEVMHDARKAILAASAHAPAGSNAATLCANSAKELAEVLDKPHARTYDNAEIAPPPPQIADLARTVTHETGRTPRQLADERAELIAALREIVPDEYTFNAGPIALRNIRELLARLQP